MNPTEPTPQAHHGALERRGTRERATLPFSCGGCTARWSGYQTCHCATCHRTFTGEQGFSRHRPGSCLDPAEVGMVLAEGRAFEAWRVP